MILLCISKWCGFRWQPDYEPTTENKRGEILQKKKKSQSHSRLEDISDETVNETEERKNLFEK